LQLIDSVAAKHGPQMKGFLGNSLFEVPENPDMLVEIADWESAEARMAVMQEAAAADVFAPFMELLAAPFRATVVKPLA
jgi:quinol monooxygenase YgiN